MYKLTRRKNLIPFVVLLGIGLAATVAVPPMFPENVFEIPAFALFPAEIALVMMLSVFFFENATPPELLRLSFTMLAFTMLSGGICNLLGRTSQTLPDQTLLLNLIQLACMNVTGLVATIALYQTKAETGGAVGPTPIREVPVPQASKGEMIEGADQVTSGRSEVITAEKIDANSGESVKDILGKLDVDRINSLESSLKNQQGTTAGSVSFESLFADESSAATDSAPKEISASAGAGSLDDLLSSPTDEAERQSMVNFDTSIPAPPVEPSKPIVTPEPIATPEPSVADASSLFDDLDIGGETAPPPAVTPEPIARTPEPSTASSGTLFDDTSLTGDLDDIFSSLAGDVAAKDEFSPEKLAEIKAAKSEVEPQPVAEVKPEGNLFGDVSEDIDDIFASLAPEDAQKEVVADLLGDLSMDEPVTPPQPTPQPDHSQAGGGNPGAGREVKEFGRLSAAATSKTELAAPGTLKTIGQMLLDTSAVENIIKRAEARGDAPVKTSSATARVVSVARGADIQSMLNEIASFPGVDGSLVIGKDGLLIGATESLGMMRDVYGVLALGMQGTTNLGTKKIDMGELRQAILRTGEKYIVMTEVGIGVLAVFSDQWNLSTIDGLLEHIGRVVKASDASGGASLPTETLGAGMLSEDAPAHAAPPQSVAPIIDEDAVVPIQDSKGGLLNVNDDDIGGLFDGVLSDSSTHDDAISAGTSTPAPTPTPAPVAAADSLLNVGDDLMDDIFDNLLDNADSAASVEQAMDFSPATESAPAAETPAAPDAPAPTSAPQKAAPGSGGQQIKEFGRLSTSSQAAAAGQESGSIKAIGRQLIDVQAVENIIKAGEKRERMGAGLTTARVISAARGEGIKALLTKIDTYPGVQGSLIVGNDGLVIASTLTGGLDKDLLGALCCAMHSHSDLAGKKLEMGKMRQIIFHATDKMTILTAVAVGVLAVFVENHDMTQIDSLLAAIEGTVRG